MSIVQLDLVAETLKDVASELVLPAYLNLGAGDVREKTPGDLVTVIDEQVEAALARRLPALLPGSILIGEESVHRDPGILKGLGEEYVWLLDPLDGTGNFVKGRPHFAIMLALLRRGHAIASWIYAPVSGDLVMAEHGGGVFYQNTLQGGQQNQRIAFAADLSSKPPTKPPAKPPAQPSMGPSASPSASDLSGVVYSRYMPDDIRQWILTRTDESFRTHLPRGAAAAEYPRLLHKEVDFLLYWRTLPWDHVPGVLMVNEAGGKAQRLDGRPYTALDQGVGLLVASDAEAWEHVLRRLEMNKLSH